MKTIQHFLWALAGATPFLLERCPGDQGKFTKSGLSILLTGIVSAVSFGFAIHSMLGAHTWLLVIVSLIWAAFIMTADSLIVATMTTGGGSNKWKSAAPRLVLAIFIGIVIAHPLELRIFDKPIRELLVRRMRVEQDSIKDKEIATLSQGGRDAAELEKLRPRIEEQQERVACLQQLETYEKTGVKQLTPCGASSGKPGAGSSLQMIQGQLQDANQQLFDLQQEANRLQGLVGNIDAKREEIINRFSQRIDSLSHQFNTQPLNILQAHQGLVYLIDEEDQEGHGSIGWMVACVMLLMITLEITPVLSKLMMSTQSYDTLLGQFNQDLVAMDMSRLLQKYPTLPGQAFYAAQCEANKQQYQKILDEHQTMVRQHKELEGELFELETDIRVRKDMHERLSNRVATEYEQLQFDIAQRLLQIWHQETLNDIRKDPSRYLVLPKKLAVSLPPPPRAYTPPKNITGFQLQK